ncbi:MAG: permease [Pseudomonadota bacterium]
MEIIFNFLLNSWHLLNMMAPFIIIGVLAAGFLHLFMPTDFVTKHLGNDNIFSVVKAALFGAPLPLCSCSVIPFAISLKKSGASNGAVLSFLISTPITGIDSIIATYGVFGWIFTLFRVISSVIIAILAGLFAPATQHQIENHKPHHPTKPTKSIKAFFDQSFNVIFKDIAKPFAFGIVLGGLMMTLIPQGFEGFVSENVFLTYLIVLLIAPPLYICATGSIPMAAAMILAGFSPGAAFILLTAGPATSTVTMSVVYKSLGKTCFIVYLLTILAGSLLFGLILDGIFQFIQLDLSEIITINEESNTVSSILLGGLLVYYLIVMPVKKKTTSCCCSEDSRKKKTC